MSDLVVDSSVAVKWILPEPDSAIALSLMSEVIARGERLVVLDVALVEIANAIWKQYHRSLTTLDIVRRFLDQLLLLPVHVESSRRLLRRAVEIATAYCRSVYDAMFVALAEDLDLPGVTADEPLIRSI